MKMGNIFVVILNVFVMGVLLRGTDNVKSRTKSLKENETLRKSVKLCKAFAKHLDEESRNSRSEVFSSSIMMNKNASIPRSIVQQILCVDLGGTSLKVCTIQVDGTKTEVSEQLSILRVVADSSTDETYSGQESAYTVKNGVYKAPIPHKNTEITQNMTIYQWMHDRIHEYMSILPEGTVLPGEGVLTFSFPLENANGKVRVTKYTKGVRWMPVQSAVAQNEIPLDEINKLMEGVVSFKIVINDVMATLFSGMHKDKNTVLGVVLGTGTNGAYFEDAKQISMMQMSTGVDGTEECAKNDEVDGNDVRGDENNKTQSAVNSHTSDTPVSMVYVMNTEWGGYSNAPVTAFQDAVNRKMVDGTVDGKVYIAEKMIGGMYFEKWANMCFSKDIKTILKRKNQYRRLKHTLDSVYIQNSEMTHDGIHRCIEHIDVPKKTKEEICTAILATYNDLQARREYILAGFIASIVYKRYTRHPEQHVFIVNMNGSGCTAPEFRDEVQKKVHAILNRMVPYFSSRHQIVMEYDDNASLTGAVYALISTTA